MEERQTLQNYQQGLEKLLLKIDKMEKKAKESILDFSERYCEKKKLSPARHLKLLTVMKKTIEYAGKPLTKLEENDIERINIGLAKSGVSKVTINDYKKFLRLYLNWSRQDSLLKSRELELLKLNGENKIQAIDLPTEEEVYKMLQASTLKYRALLALFYGAGLRLSEAACLKHGAVQFQDDGSIICHVQGKTGHRSVPIQPSLAAFVKEYINQAGLQDDESVLFAGDNGNRFLSYNAIVKALKRAAKKAGIAGKRKINPHAYRHAHATWSLLHLSAPLAKMRMWGSGTSAMDKNYLHVTEQQAHEDYRRATGLDKAPPKKELFESKVCFKCGKSFNALFSVCDVCNLPLNPLETIKRQQEADESKQKLETLFNLVAVMGKEISELRKGKK